MWEARIRRLVSEASRAGDACGPMWAIQVKHCSALHPLGSLYPSLPAAPPSPSSLGESPFSASLLSAATSFQGFGSQGRGGGVEGEGVGGGARGLQTGKGTLWGNRLLS